MNKSEKREERVHDRCASRNAKQDEIRDIHDFTVHGKTIKHMCRTFFLFLFKQENKYDGFPHRNVKEKQLRYVKNTSANTFSEER